MNANGFSLTESLIALLILNLCVVSVSRVQLHYLLLAQNRLRTTIQWTTLANASNFLQESCQGQATRCQQINQIENLHCMAEGEMLQIRMDTVKLKVVGCEKISNRINTH